MITKDLLDILACPVCKLPIALAQDQQSLRCAQCHRSFPIRDGIPVLLVDRPSSKTPENPAKIGYFTLLVVPDRHNVSTLRFLCMARKWGVLWHLTGATNGIYRGLYIQNVARLRSKK